MNRPSRRTQVVNYREFNDVDDDEDFASSKAPPCKKARVDVKQPEQRKSSGKSSSQETNSESTHSQKSRRPLDQKLYERDLEAAITLSLLNNVETIKDRSPTSKGDVKDENTDPSMLHLSNCSVNGAVMGLDEITPEKAIPAQSRQSKAATEQPRKKQREEDEEYQPKLTPGVESDEDFSAPDESEDEEFTVKKGGKSKKKEKATKKEKSKPVSKKEKKPPQASRCKSVTEGVFQEKSASRPVSSPPTATHASRRPASSSTVSTAKPEVSLSPAGGKIPKWNPPGQIGRSPTSSHSLAIKSPGQGLRLGLSRLVRVKPLHPSVASH